MGKKGKNNDSEKKYFQNIERGGDERFSVPDSYSRIDPVQLKEMQLPEDSVGFTTATSNATGLIVGYTVPREAAMPFDRPEELIAFLHETMNDNQGIIEVNTGKCRDGGRYVYYIMKYWRGEDDISSRFYGYQLNFNFEVGAKVYFISGSFEEAGMTGHRASVGIMLLAKAKEQAGQIADLTDIMENEWASDPYDPGYTKGFLMNWSEGANLDSIFPEHPLSLTRELIRYVIENN